MCLASLGIYEYVLVRVRIIIVIYTFLRFRVYNYLGTCTRIVTNTAYIAASSVFLSSTFRHYDFQRGRFQSGHSVHAEPG